MPTNAQKAENAARKPKAANTPAPSGETPDKLTIRRPARAQRSPEETRARVEAFTKEREEAFVAAVREDEG